MLSLVQSLQDIWNFLVGPMPEREHLAMVERHQRRNERKTRRDVERTWLVGLADLSTKGNWKYICQTFFKPPKLEEMRQLAVVVVKEVPQPSQRTISPSSKLSP